MKCGCSELRQWQSSVTVFKLQMMSRLRNMCGEAAVHEAETEVGQKIEYTYFIALYL